MYKQDNWIEIQNDELDGDFINYLVIKFYKKHLIINYTYENGDYSTKKIIYNKITRVDIRKSKDLQDYYILFITDGSNNSLQIDFVEKSKDTAIELYDLIIEKMENE